MLLFVWLKRRLYLKVCLNVCLMCELMCPAQSWCKLKLVCLSFFMFYDIKSICNIRTSHFHTNYFHHILHSHKRLSYILFPVKKITDVKRWIWFTLKMKAGDFQRSSIEVSKIKKKLAKQGRKAINGIPNVVTLCRNHSRW